MAEVAMLDKFALNALPTLAPAFCFPVIDPGTTK